MACWSRNTKFCFTDNIIIFENYLWKLKAWPSHCHCALCICLWHTALHQCDFIHCLVELFLCHSARMIEDAQDIGHFTWLKEHKINTGDKIMKLYFCVTFCVWFIRKGDTVTAQDVRQYVTEYVRSNELQDTNNKRFSWHLASLHNFCGLKQLFNALYACCTSVYF